MSAENHGAGCLGIIKTNSSIAFSVILPIITSIPYENFENSPYTDYNSGTGGTAARRFHTDIDNVGEEWPPPFLASYLDPVFRNILIHAVDSAHPIVVCMDVEWLRNIDPFPCEVDHRCAFVIGLPFPVTSQYRQCLVPDTAQTG
jgi:hypothetical protein